MNAVQLTTRPLTESTWPDFVAVLGDNGGARGCWCMHWRLSMNEWMENKGAGNRAAMHDLARGEREPGLVAYLGDEPVAWCGYGDRSDYPRMRRSPLMKPVDDEDVVSLTCLYVRKGHRGSGLLARIIAAVCDHLARTSRSRWVEAYPVDPAPGQRVGADNAMTGVASAYRAAGFTEVARPRADRPVLRYPLR